MVHLFHVFAKRWPGISLKVKFDKFWIRICKWETFSFWTWVGVWEWGELADHPVGMTYRGNDIWISVMDATCPGGSSSDHQDMSSWVWRVDGTRTLTQWHNWRPGTPTDTNECCARLVQYQGDYAWNDRGCNILHSYLCQSLQGQNPGVATLDYFDVLWCDMQKYKGYFDQCDDKFWWCLSNFLLVPDRLPVVTDPVFLNLVGSICSSAFIMLMS